MAFLTYFVSFGLLFQVSFVEAISDSRNTANLGQKNCQLTYRSDVDKPSYCSEDPRLNRTDELLECATRSPESMQVAHRGSGRNCSRLDC